MMAALSLHLPLTGTEAQILGRAQFGATADTPIPQFHDLAAALGGLLLPDAFALRGPFVVSMMLGGLALIRISAKVGVGTHAANLGLAWGFTTVLVLGGGALAGPGPLGFLTLSAFTLAVLRLAATDQKADWIVLWGATVLMVYAIPELATAVVAVAMAPVLLRPCRRWLLRPGYWATLGSATLLVIPSAQIAGIDVIWPAISLQAGIGWQTLWLVFAASPLVLSAMIYGLLAGPGVPSQNPPRTLVYLICLGCTVSLIASGVKPALLLAMFPLMAIPGADAVLRAGTRMGDLIANLTLPLSVAGLLTLLVLEIAPGAPFWARFAPLPSAQGWVGMAYEVDALADQNGVGWIAVDRPGDAVQLQRSLPRRLPIIVIGHAPVALVDCAKPGLFLGDVNGPSLQMVFDQYRMVLPIERSAAAGSSGARRTAVTGAPIDRGHCVTS